MDDSKLAEEILRLRRSVGELSVLNDLARTIGASVDLGTIMNAVVSTSAAAIGAEQATITLVSRDNQQIDRTIVRRVKNPDDPHYHINEALVGMMLGTRRPVAMNDSAQHGILKDAGLHAGVSNVVCAPLLAGDELVGVLAAYNKKNGDAFDQDDERLLGIIGIQSAQVIERARLLEEERAAQAIREELQTAANIQLRLLPESSPAIPGFEISGKSIPARQVGGDYFDYIELEGGEWGVAIGDISGKGVPASLLMANLQATIRSHAHLQIQCNDCVRSCNRLLFRSTRTDRFATLFYCRLDPGTGRLTYCNAGHEKPFVIDNAGELKTLGTNGIPVGMLDDFNYEQGRLQLSSGDCLVMYSDGVTDMQDLQENFFGLERLVDLVRGARGLAAADIVDRITSEVISHARGVDPLDDVTLVILKKTNE